MKIVVTSDPWKGIRYPQCLNSTLSELLGYRTTENYHLFHHPDQVSLKKLFSTHFGTMMTINSFLILEWVPLLVNVSFMLFRSQSTSTEVKSQKTLYYSGQKQNSGRGKSSGLRITKSQDHLDYKLTCAETLGKSLNVSKPQYKRVTRPMSSCHRIIDLELEEAWILTPSFCS